MKCPCCGNIEDKVLNTYHKANKFEIKRYRICLICGCKFNTIEKVYERRGRAIQGGVKMSKIWQWFLFQEKVDEHIRQYVIPQYGDFPDDIVEGFTVEKIQAKLEAYVRRIGKSARGKEDAFRDCLKIAHYACYLHSILTTRSAHSHPKRREDI